MTGISNGMLRSMSDERRANMIAAMAPKVRLALVRLAVLGADRHMGSAEASDVTPARIAFHHGEAHELLGLAIELATEGI